MRRTNYTNATIKNGDMTAPNQADLDELNGAERVFADAPWQDGVRHRGFQLSAATRKELASESCFNRMRRVMRDAHNAGLQLYHTTHVLKGYVHDEETGDTRMELKEETRFMTMQEHIRALSRKRGSVAADAREILISVYREGWADAVNVKYGELTQSQKDRRVDGGITSWQSQTDIRDSFSKDPDIALQLSIPELRWLRGNQVQREAALSQVRWAIHCLFWAASEARKANPTFDWQAGPTEEAPLNIPIETNQHWDDAVVAMHLYMRMATRFVDANERKLMIKAVIWEIYHCDFHLPVIEYLTFISDTTEEQSKLNEFLCAFNHAEVQGIKRNAAKAWHKARAFFFGGGAIRGLNSDESISAPSLNAIANFTDWWRKWAARAKARADVGRVLDDIPEDQRDFLAEQHYEAESWDELEDWQKEKLALDWANGQQAHRAWLEQLAREKATQAARQAEIDKAAADDAERRAMAAFPKPSAIVSFSEKEYRDFNPEHKEKEEKKRQKEEAARKAGKKPRRAASLAGTSSDNGTTTNGLLSKRKKPAKKARVAADDSDDEVGPPPGGAGAADSSSADSSSSDEEENEASKASRRKPSARKVVYTSDEGEEMDDSD